MSVRIFFVVTVLCVHEIHWTQEVRTIVTNRGFMAYQIWSYCYFKALDAFGVDCKYSKIFEALHGSKLLLSHNQWATSFVYSEIK